MVAEGTPFRGVLFAGLMIKDGRVSLLGGGYTAVGTHGASGFLLCPMPDDCKEQTSLHHSRTSPAGTMWDGVAGPFAGAQRAVRRPRVPGPP